MAEQPSGVARFHDIASVMSRTTFGRSKVFQYISTGQLRSVKVGSRRVVSEAALTEFITGLDQQSVKEAKVVEVEEAATPREQPAETNA
jgi:hypothetical protein